MKLENEFTVDTSVDEVWSVLLNLERITPCLPGAALAEETGDGEYRGTMKVRLGPVTQEYNGTVQISEADESERRAVLEAKGKDARGQGTASATITSTLHEVNGGQSTRVRVETDMQVTGRAAQFGRGVQQDVAEKIMNRFAECLSNEIIGGGAGEEAASEPSTDGAPEGAAVVEEQDQRETGQQEQEVEALDLGEASRGAVLARVKPLVPIAAGVGALALVVWLLRKGRSEGRSGVERGEIKARLRF
jgi:carbon monoxide dehydrogenase subunit G